MCLPKGARELPLNLRFNKPLFSAHDLANKLSPLICKPPVKGHLLQEAFWDPPPSLPSGTLHLELLYQGHPSLHLQLFYKCLWISLSLPQTKPNFFLPSDPHS